MHPYAGIAFDDPLATYTYLINELNQLDFTFVELMKRSPMFPLLPHYPQGDEIEIFGKLVSHTLVAGTAYTRESGEAELQKGIVSLIAYGSLFLANPDLPRRFEQNAALNAPDRPPCLAAASMAILTIHFFPPDPPGVKNKTASDTQAVFHAFQIFRSGFLKMRRLR